MASTHFKAIRRLQEHLNERIIGQERLVERLFIALLADGHLLVEGAPGLAKTRAIKELASGLEGDFQRIQFTPDLLPADLTGTDIYRPQDGSFHFQRGPLFHHLILADEINRAPAKVQSALLEAMAERQVTIGHESYPLPALFLVMATQNPIEQEGTYPLPEAQLDRFLMHVRIDYPSRETEHKILALVRDETRARADQEIAAPAQSVTQESLFKARGELTRIHMSDAVEAYLVHLVMATRDPAPFGDELAAWVEFGASPRGTLALDACARAHAWLDERDFVTPSDIQSVAHDCLRHRIILTFEAEASGVDSDAYLDRLLEQLPVP